MWRCKMIYRKDANFPYPVLTNTSNSYDASNFILDVNLQENNKEYHFNFSYDLDSPFIHRLLESQRAQLYLVIQSKDNKFFPVRIGESSKAIPKSRISLSKRTVVQLLIQSKEEISFRDNGDLNPFYSEFKDEIVVPKSAILGFSNSVIFEGSSRKPLELFEKKLSPSLKSDIEIELGSETIIIHYKTEDLQFTDSQVSQALNNPYVYMGLQKALYRFLMNNSEDGESVDLTELEEPIDTLDLKLFNLLRSKMIQELSMENIDEVIYLISDRVLEKYAAAVKGLYKDGN